MAVCHTCRKTVDIEATICNNCGRPNPTKMRKGEGCASVIGIVIGIAFAIVVALVIWADKHALPTEHSSTSQTDSVDTSEPRHALAQPTPDSNDTPYITQQDSTETPETNATFNHNPTEVTPVQNPENPTTEFPYSARLTDSRGKIVIQSGPSVFSKNVESVPTGIHVQASSKEGKWISVQLDDGKIGFVRQTQLQFD